MSNAGIVLKVCRQLYAFEKRQKDPAVIAACRRLRGNLEIAAHGRPSVGFNFVLAEQVEQLRRLMCR